MKKIRNLLLGVVTLGMLLSGCSGTAPTSLLEETSTTDPSKPVELTDEEMIDVLSGWNPTVTYTLDKDFEPVFDEEMQAVPLSQQERLSSAMFDVPLGETINIKLQGSNSFSNSYQKAKYEEIIVKNLTYDKYVTVSDVDGRNQDILLTTDGTRLSIPINSSYIYGAVYTVELLKKDELYFEGKDPSIQKLTIEIEDDPAEAENIYSVDLKDDIPVLDLSKVSEENLDESSIFSFVYNGSDASLNELKEGEVFLVKNNKNDDKLEITDFYGKFLSKEDLGNGKYKISYVEPQGDEIYDELRNKGSAELNLEGNITPNYEDEEFVNSIRYSSFARGYLNFYTKYSRNKNKEVLGDILDNLKIDITYNYYNSKLTFSLKIYVDQIQLSETLFLSFAVKYTQAATFSVDFDIGIKTKWFVPVGISYKLKMSQVKQESFEFDIAIKYEKKTEPIPEDEIKNTLYDEIQKAKEGNESFYNRLVNDAKAVAQTEGNKTTIPLFSVTCPVYPPVVFEFKIDFIIDLSVQAMLVIKKQWESETTFFNFSNQKGGDGDTSQNITASSFWDVYLMGTIELTFSLRVSGSLYIEGTYKFCHVEVYIEIYVKIGVQGVLMASFESLANPLDFNGNVTLDLYVQMGAKVGLEIVLAFLKKDFSIDLFKTYILRIVFSNEIQEYSNDAAKSIVMNTSIMSIDDTEVLNFKTWNGVTMREEFKKHKAKDPVKLIESWFGDLNVRMFSFEPEKPEWVEISDSGVIHILDHPDRPADLYTSFKIKVSGWAGINIPDREISIEFHDPNAHHIYIDDVDAGRYSKGNTFILPEPEKRDGYKFLNYVYNEQQMQAGDSIIMGEEDIYITTEWHKIIYYTVLFYDGFNNLIQVNNHVEEFTAATPPTPEVRDYYMSGYFFIGWDKKIDYITSDLAVHGVYMKVGD